MKTGNVPSMFLDYHIASQSETFDGDSGTAALQTQRRVAIAASRTLLAPAHREHGPRPISSLIKLRRGRIEHHIVFERPTGDPICLP